MRSFEPTADILLSAQNFVYKIAVICGANEKG